MKATLTIKKKIFVIVATVLILLSGLGILTINTAVDEVELVHASMVSTMTAFENKFKRSESLDEISSAMGENLIVVSRYLIETAFKEADDIQTALDTLEIDQCDFYLVSQSGELFAAKGADELNLSDNQLNSVLSGEVLTVESGENIFYYTCFDLPQGKLISCYKKSLELGYNSILTGISDRFSCFIASMPEGVIKQSTNDVLIDTQIPEKIGMPDFIKNYSHLRKVPGYDYGFADLSSGKAYCMIHKTDKYAFGLYYDRTEILFEIINEMITPFVVIGGSFAVILLFFFILWNNADERKHEWSRFFRTKSYFDKSQVQHLSCFVVLTLVITLLFNAHFFEFSAYSMQNGLSTQNLDMLAENIEASEKDKEIVLEHVEDYAHAVGRQLSELISLNNNLINHESLKKIAENCYIDEISVFDIDGRIEASSGKYSKYELTQNEDNPLYAVRRIFTDDPEYVFVNYDDESGRYALAQRRADDAGIVLTKYESPYLKEILKYYSTDEAIKGTDFGNATTFFVKLDKSDATYVIEPFTTKILSTYITLPEELKVDNYSGTAEIGGMKVYVNSRNSEGVAIISAIPVNQLNELMTVCSLEILFAFILLMIVLFIGCLCKPEMCEEEKTDSAEQSFAATGDRNNESMIEDTCFRKMVEYESIVFVIGYCLMMFKKTVGGKTLLEFIIEGNWDKGINLFSINASVVGAVITVVIVSLIKKLLLFIGKSIGAKGLTVCSIIGSVVRFLGLFFIILHTLYQFGVNTTALVASAGVAGVVIGIAAKDIFGDLLSGLFLIFEGNIRVGDFIKFNGFRGEVSEIGARVTVIKRFNNKLIVNNSDFRQYFRLSDELGIAFVEVAVGPDEDIDRIRKLIEESAEWYQSNIPELKRGPHFLNVSAFASTGITICLRGECDESKSESVKRKILQKTMELFRENGITLAMDAIRLIPAKSDD